MADNLNTRRRQEPEPRFVGPRQRPKSGSCSPTRNPKSAMTCLFGSPVKRQFKAGCRHSVSTAESKGGTATGRSPVKISNDRSTTWTGRSAGATGAKFGNDRSRCGRAGALDPRPSNLLRNSRPFRAIHLEQSHLGLLQAQHQGHSDTFSPIDCQPRSRKSRAAIRPSHCLGTAAHPATCWRPTPAGGW